MQADSPLRREALIIESDPERRAALGRWVGDAGFAARAAETPEKARSDLSERRFELVLAEPGTLDSQGLALFSDLSARPSPVTATSSAEASWDVRRRPGFSRFGRLIGGSARMQRVYDEIVRVAPTFATVFLIGESGTGKELAAELIHGLSPRSSHPFVPVNCGALSPTLIESELFGHERGSFTGADRRRPGVFEIAQGGTLFLDEITEMPLDLQVKLLRVLESGTLRRVGGEESIDVDVRVIAATNRDPEEAVANGQLREDLLYRLLVFPIELPPLRRRADDIAGIAQHFLSQLNQRSAERKEFRGRALEELSVHAWPGNVRELRNVVERAFIVSDEAISETALSLDPTHAPAEHDDALGVSVGMTIAEAERRLILANLEHLRGDKKKAAKVLGISLKTLYSRLAVYRAASGSRSAARECDAVPRRAAGRAQ